MTVEHKKLRVGVIFGGRSGEHEVDLGRLGVRLRQRQNALNSKKIRHRQEVNVQNMTLQKLRFRQ